MNRMTTFIIGVILAVLFMTSFGLIMADVNSRYAPTTYNESDMETFQKMEEIQNLTSSVKSRVENQTTDRGLVDVIGNFIADGKDTLLLAASSYGLFEDMADEGLEHVNAPRVFNVAFGSILLVLIFLGVILAAILGRRL